LDCPAIRYASRERQARECTTNEWRLVRKPNYARFIISAKIIKIGEHVNNLPDDAHDRVHAIYPGSFDPITNGHLDLIQRGARMFGRLTVAILRNESKAPMFSVEERMEMLSEVVAKYPNVEVDSFDGLLVDYAVRRSATVLLRGIRAISDYEYELQMALMNRRLAPDIETIFMMANEAYSFISSRLVKEVGHLGGNISGLVPTSVEARVRQRFSKFKNEGA
jgi:pantetheine-phosphate adenylyltransferase